MHFSSISNRLFKSKKQSNFFIFCKINWLSAFINSLSSGSSVCLVTLEPFIEEESLKFCFYKGIYVNSSVSLNSLSITLRQEFNGLFVDRTFFLNSSNCVFLSKF